MEAENIAKLVRLHEAQKKAKRDHYHRHKEEINERRRRQYADKKAVAEGGSTEGVVVGV
jgi:hypothetical protein